MATKRPITEDDYISLKDVEAVLDRRVEKLKKAGEKSPRKKKRYDDIIVNLLAVKSQLETVVIRDQIAHVGYNAMQMGREK